MNLLNTTRMAASCTLGLEPSGRELLVVVVKGTFAMPACGDPVRLAEAQAPLVTADTFTGTPGFSAPMHEFDYAPRKTSCDVLVVGHARTPQGRPMERLRAGLRVGPILKTFDVVGDREWQASLLGARASRPVPFTEKMVSYDVAFGGWDRSSKDAQEHDAYSLNPVGRGWQRNLGKDAVDGKPMPNTEETNRPIKVPDGTYAPMAFGALGRGWPQRARYAGTYDQRWLDETCPFLPRDFDERYFQGAPLDQQMPSPTAPVDVVLGGFSEHGPIAFTLPLFEAPVHVFPKHAPAKSYAATLDTIVFEPDQSRFTMCWRVAHPLRRSLHEIDQVLVGRRDQIWWQGQAARAEAGALTDE